MGLQRFNTTEWLSLSDMVHDFTEPTVLWESYPTKSKIKTSNCFREVYTAILEEIDPVVEIRKLLESQGCFFEEVIIELRYRGRRANEVKSGEEDSVC